ncbi:hypothetical protein F4778DRAFT_726299 [Xylariomycetidae sp. FL2044]|nr:hypothetical protein F4778DRAFT_726299 [Xylariomycetidae sp. FL2044]
MLRVSFPLSLSSLLIIFSFFLFSTHVECHVSYSFEETLFAPLCSCILVSSSGLLFSTVAVVTCRGPCSLSLGSGRFLLVIRTRLN